MLTTPISRRALHTLRLTLLFVGAVVLGACNDFLKATNPGAIEADRLTDSIYTNLLVNGVIGEFQPMFIDVAFWSSKFTDEVRNHHVFQEEVDMDMRRVAPENATYAIFVYNPMQRTRWLADSITSRLRAMIPDSANNSLRVARVLAYAGYTYNMMGEMLCGVTFNLSATYPPDSAFRRAIARFTEARTVATAFKTAVGGTSVAADSIIDLSNVGIARANLGLGDWAAAATAAALVTNTAFTFRAYYHSNSTRQANRFYLNASSGSTGNNTISVTPYFQQNDVRVPYPATNEGTQNGVAARVPNSPSAFSSYTGTLPGGEFAEITSVRIASYIEAQHILHEARLRQSNTTGALAWINARRAAGGQTPYVGALDATSLLNELIRQRALDLYLDAHRLGDMRRYLKRGNGDFYERGTYVGSTTGLTYGDQVCLPLTSGELQGNPNATQPANNVP